MAVSTSEHSDLILDQFTRQAVPFSTAPSIKDEAALTLIVIAFALMIVARFVTARFTRYSR